MAVTLRNLMKHDWFKHTITLVTDETGLDTMVTWPYIRQTDEIGAWLNGGEMIFVFHQADTAELQIELLKEGIQAKVSCFCFFVRAGFYSGNSGRYNRFCKPESSGSVFHAISCEAD